ncbi:MAG TPA: type II toxin-antitoxin system YoeB family toxin [Nocardioidaceae bacterium]|nr:type II toxin-antitoxin system YoeB family toxin [Nocardioidaceae bacterium]
MEVESAGPRWAALGGSGVASGSRRVTGGDPNASEDYVWWRSRRITDEHRLVYKVTEHQVRIAACRYQYGR